MLSWLRRRRYKKNKLFFDHPLPWFHSLLEPNKPDYRGMPSSVCPCGNGLFIITASFDRHYGIAGYYLDGVCTFCGAIVSVPCEADGPNPLERNDDMQTL